MTNTYRPLSVRWRSRRGVASALIILLLVLLIFFGVLALVTSAADLRLSQKRAEWNQQYYLADARTVALLADIDQYCRALSQEELKPGTLAGLLEDRLAGAKNVQSFQADQTDGAVLLTLLVAEQPDQGQGIRLQLRVESGAAGQDPVRLVIEGWEQWQPSFQYDGTGSSVWKG